METAGISQVLSICFASTLDVFLLERNSSQISSTNSKLNIENQFTVYFYKKLLPFSAFSTFLFIFLIPVVAAQEFYSKKAMQNYRIPKVVSATPKPVPADPRPLSSSLTHPTSTFSTTL